jgi:hypothetical protein
MRRRLQRGKPGSVDRITQLLDDEGVVLDTAEQAEVVQALETAHAAQSQLWRLCLGALGFILGSMLVWFGVSQARRPWVGYRHHSVFHRTAPAGLVAVSEVLSGAAALMSAAGLCVRLVPRITVRQRHEDGQEGRKDAGAVASSWRQREVHMAWFALLVTVVMAVFWACCCGRHCSRPGCRALRHGSCSGCPLLRWGMLDSWLLCFVCYKARKRK